MIKPTSASEETSTPADVILVEHWFEELTELVPVN